MWILALALPPGGSAQPGLIFADNFESGDISTWSRVTGEAELEALCPTDFQGPVQSTYTLEGCYREGASALADIYWQVVSAPTGHSYDVVSFAAPPSLTCDVSPYDLRFFADVVGTYTYELAVSDSDGLVRTCQTSFSATTDDVVRVEMYWNPDYDEAMEGPDESDVDLYLMRNPDDEDPTWYYYRDPVSSGLPCPADPNPDSCHWRNCSTCPPLQTCGTPPDVYYSLGACDVSFASSQCQALPATEQVRECLCREYLSNPPPGTLPDDIWPVPVLSWGAGGDEDDPRLDLEDTEGKGPESINLRQPTAGTYRVAVHFFDADGFGVLDPDGCRRAEVGLRVICAGAVVYETEIVQLGYHDSLFGYWESDLWEVGDLTISYAGVIPVCAFTEFGTAGDRRICKMKLATGGCAVGEVRACEAEPSGICGE